jgi:hypothetical protein
MAFSHGTPNSIVTDGLVFYIDAANKDSYSGSGTTVTDLMGLRNGTLNGNTFQTNNGGVIDFDGIDDNITFGTPQSGDIMAATNSFTNSIWLKRTGDTIYSNVMVIWQQRRSNLGYGYDGVAGTVTNKAYSYVGASALNGNNVISQNVWHNFVFTINGSNSAILYVDGVSQNSGTRSAESNVGSVFYIGRSSSGNYANMEVGCASYYNRALSASEVTQNYNALKNRFRT